MTIYKVRHLSLVNTMCKSKVHVLIFSIKCKEVICSIPEILEPQK